MDREKESRSDARHVHEATILIEDIPKGTYYHGQMVNYSVSGMYFESHLKHEPGAPIIFSIEDSPYRKCPGVYHGRIKWCRPLPETASLFGFGMGVEYFKATLPAELGGQPRNVFYRSPPPDRVTTDQIPTGRTRVEDTADKAVDNRQNIAAQADNQREYRRRPFDRPVLYATRNRFFKGTIKDISKGGVFIEAPDMIAVGQRLTLAIPSARNRRGLKLKGEIVRIDPNGLAVRFNSIIKN
jgi:hypothetical protein